ncbi:MAG: ATP-binding cassette domain-containing protein [Bacilli bacterium]|nr:ATP-binding cassette domain-containing protein [Bacilli bacterium]
MAKEKKVIAEEVPAKKAAPKAEVKPAKEAKAAPKAQKKEAPVANEAKKDRKVLLNLRHVDVKFNVRGRILNAIRDISLEIYDGESIAIVGESGSGKSVLTKTFAGMLDSNGFISHGKIIFSDDELSKTYVHMDNSNMAIYNKFVKYLNEISHYFYAADIYQQIKDLKKEFEARASLNKKEQEEYADKLKDINDDINDTSNLLQTLNPKVKEDKDLFVSKKAELKDLKKAAKELEKHIKAITKEKKAALKADAQYLETFKLNMANLTSEYDNRVNASKERGLDQEILDRNEKLAKEVVLSISRYPFYNRIVFIRKLFKNFKDFALRGKDIGNPKQLDKIYANVTFRVEYRSGEAVKGGELYGFARIDCAKVKFTKDWQKIRGCKIATVFQDPMTSLNPIIPIGKQIMTVIIKHQKCSQIEAKKRAIDMMNKVGIPNAEERFYDYPFQYSGGMRQRIVIAIALSCQPKILICDEPTTALDVTIQAQIIRLIGDLAKELHFTTVYITHDLGVVANVAERVAVLYGGQIVELGTVEDIFYDPKHPYTWALLSSLPQLSERGTDLFSIPGTPPSLYNKIVGDAFAPRSSYALAIDYAKEPPMFQVSDTHYAKTWLLDPRAPKVEKPELICNLHEKMVKIYKTEE